MQNLELLWEIQANIVLANCSENYVKKAKKREFGVGYETKILIPKFNSNEGDIKIFPIIRNNVSDTLVPTYLKSEVYTDFRNDKEFNSNSKFVLF